VAVFRRGPSRWAHIGRWDLDNQRYEGGAWLGGRIFPRRSDLSPDGRWLCYFAHKPGARWEHGDSYVAISKLPWLTALHAFPTCGTWTRGYHFTTDERARPNGAALPIPFGLVATHSGQFETERRRGWIESPDSPARDPGDAWDQHRNARMEKAQPGGTAILHVESLGWAGGEFAEQAIDGMRVCYWLERDGDLVVLDDVQWADWDRVGRLLVATRSGLLQIRSLAGGAHEVVLVADLSALEPNPQPAPAGASEW
jgi:hypothetical protein